MRNHSANLRSLISVWKLDFSKKKYAAQFAIRLFKNKKSNSGSGIRLFRKKACGAICDWTFHFCGMVSHFAPVFHNFGDRFRNPKLQSPTSGNGFLSSENQFQDFENGFPTPKSHPQTWKVLSRGGKANGQRRFVRYLFFHYSNLYYLCIIRKDHQPTDSS